MSGAGHPALVAVDEAMVRFMRENDIPGATVAIALDGEVVFERGYGWADEARTEAMRPDAMMRLASVSKPITMAAVRTLIEEGAFGLESFAFDLGQDGGGLLKLSPYPELGDERLRGVTVRHLMRHEGGWDRSTAGDLTYMEVPIAGAFGVASPPGRERTVRWILGRRLEFAPGERSAYSNIGALTLGLILEEREGMALDEVIQRRVLDPIGVADGDHVAGRTFLADRDAREPWYHGRSGRVNVFDPVGARVDGPCGSWDHEARIGQGGQVATAEALARFAAHYWVNGERIGVRKSPTARGGWKWNHTGSLDGTGALVRQRGDGLTYGVLFNSRGHGGAVRGVLDDVLDGVEWGEKGNEEGGR